MCSTSGACTGKSELGAIFKSRKPRRAATASTWFRTWSPLREVVVEGQRRAVVDAAGVRRRVDVARQLVVPARGRADTRGSARHDGRRRLDAAERPHRAEAFDVVRNDA
jgi:hypothetical protein